MSIAVLMFALFGCSGEEAAAPEAPAVEEAAEAPAEEKNDGAADAAEDATIRAISSRAGMGWRVVVGITPYSSFAG